MSITLDSAFPSKSDLIRCADLNDEDLTVTITDVVEEKLGQGEDSDVKPVLSFKEHKKRLALNVTNFKQIAKILEKPDAESWMGDRVTLFPTECDYGGEMKACIRVRSKLPSSGSVAPAAEVPVFGAGNGQRLEARLADENLPVGALRQYLTNLHGVLFTDGPETWPRSAHNDIKKWIDAGGEMGNTLSDDDIPF